MKNFIRSVAIATTISLGSVNIYASQNSAKVQEMIQKYHLNIIKYDYVKKAIGNGTRKNASAIILDARPVKKYKSAHIPTAIALPDTKFDKYYDIFKTGILKDKSKEIIVYCGGKKCTKSPKVAQLLQKNGHKNVKVYVDGMPDWKANNYTEIDIKVAKVLFDKKDTLFIDSRPYGKFAGSTIVGALSVPDTKFEKYSKFMPIDKNVNIVTFCGGMKCHKSHSVAKKLVKIGYKNVKVLATGFPKWKSKEFPITGKSSNAKITTVKKYIPTKSKSGMIMKGADKGTVDGNWFAKNYNNLSNSITIVDVRDKKDYNQGHIKNAIHIQAEKIKPQELAMAIPQNKDVVFYCGTGTRAMESYEFLKEINYKRLDYVWYLDANIDCDKNAKCKIKPNEPMGI
jgi:rhodanese-related sulfurtransferase